MPRKKANAEEIQQQQVSAQSEQVPPAEKKPPRQKKETSAPQAMQDAPANEQTSPDTPRKKNTGRGRRATKKDTEKTGAKPAEQSNVKEETASEPTQTNALALPAPNENLPAPAVPRDVSTAVPPVHLGELKEERRSFWGRFLLLLAVGVVLAVSVLIFVYRPTRYSAHSHSIRFLYNAAQNTTQVIYDGELCDSTLEGECTRSMYDGTGSICAAAIGGKLYFVQGDEIEEISSTVQDFLLAQNGRVLVYRDAENQLHYVDLTDDFSRHTLSRDSRDARYCLSPDGEMLFYTYVTAKEAEAEKTHAAVFSISGKKPFFPETTGIIPVAIANDFEHIFYLNEAGDLYYMNAESEVSLCRRYDEGGMEILFDREFEEVLVKDAKGVMLWQDGKQIIIPQLKGAETLTLIPNQRVDFRELPVGRQCLVASFDANYYLKKGADPDGARLSYLSGGQLTEVAFISETESRPVVTDKGVYYLERAQTAEGVRKHLYFCPLGETVAERLSWDVEDFCVNSDGSRILHVDHQGWLYAARVSGAHLDSEFISDYVDDALLDSNATDIFYYFVDGSLYASNNGEKPKEAMSEEIDSVIMDAHTAIFFAEQEDGTYTVYTKFRNRQKLELVASGITSAH